MDPNKWKIQKVIKDLESFKGSGTSMVTIFIRAGAQVAPMRQKLVEELGTASNIKSRVNRQSVIAAISSAQQLLKNYNNAPKNGLAVFCGEAASSDGDKVRKVSKIIEPPEPLTRGFYMCDDKFHVEDLYQMIEDAEAYGYIIVDGSGALLANVKGSKKTVLSSFTVELPNKHGRGGQSKVRFERLREEAINVYITKVCEAANRAFLSGDIVNVSSIIIAGSGSKKDLVKVSDALDARVAAKIVHSLDIAYGGTVGLNQAIADSVDIIADLQLGKERKIVLEFMEEIVKDSGKYCFGPDQTIRAIMAGAAAKVIIWSEYAGRLPADLGDSEEDTFLEWLVNNGSKSGVDHVNIVSDSTAEGSQFCHGFGGIAAILRWKIDLTPTDETTTHDEVTDTAAAVDATATTTATDVDFDAFDGFM